MSHPAVNGEMILTPEDAALLLPALQQSDAPSWVSGNRVAWHQLLERIEACAALVPPPLNGDKVWYGLTMGLVRNGRQSETIVRAKSQAEASRLLELAGEGRTTVGHLRNYWSVTGNREQLCVAVERGVWVKGSNGWIKK